MKHPKVTAEPAPAPSAARQHPLFRLFLQKKPARRFHRAGFFRSCRAISNGRAHRKYGYFLKVIKG